MEEGYKNNKSEQKKEGISGKESSECMRGVRGSVIVAARVEEVVRVVW